MEEKYRIDPELNSVLPKLSEEDYTALEKSLLTDGYKGAPIMIWDDVIVDGHNRYEICNKHNIPYEVKKIDFENREEAMRWMVRQQIGRRNLTPIQRISISEKYRPFCEKEAKANQSKAGKEYGNGGTKLTANLPQASDVGKKERNPTTDKKLADMANVSEKTYRMGTKILNSGNEKLIEQTLKGEKSINKAYNELKESQKKESYNTNGNTDSSDLENELQDLKENKRKEAASKVRETREEYGFESPEYNVAKEEQLNVEMQINDLENRFRNFEIISKVKMIQKRYMDYLDVFQNDIDWLLSMEFYKNDEEVTSSVHSDLRNCLERFKGIDDLIKKMTVDDLDCIVINK